MTFRWIIADENDCMLLGPKYFVNPDEFIAERWTDRPELVLDKRAWHPFIIGKQNARPRPTQESKRECARNHIHAAHQ